MQKLLESLKIKPKNIKYYEEALTHKSYYNINPHEGFHYNMLEFLGDSLLSFKVSRFLFKHDPKMSEGDASLIRIKIVNTDTLAILSKQIGLLDYIKISNNSDYLLNSTKIAVDIFEAFLAAIYVDLGDSEVDKFLKKHLVPLIKKELKATDHKDAKTSFQELMQSMGKNVINYQTTKNAKDNNFTSILFCNDKKYGVGEGKTKKEAEKNAAQSALDKCIR